VNEVVKAILERRSVRDFTIESVTEEDLQILLECARYAPSANNTQNWHFTAIRDPEIIGKVNGWIAEEIRESGNPGLQGILERTGGKVFRNAPCVILVSTEKQDRFGIINASAATQNILLAAQSLGLGSCWIGTVGILGTSARADQYASQLRIPEGYAPFFGVTLGHKAPAHVEPPARKEGVVTIA
jgi:nitroreductase